jgi:hypothetical protein
MDELETINPFTLAPWEERIPAFTDETTATLRNDGYDIRITVSSSARNGLVGVGGAVTLPAAVYGSPKLGTFSSTLGPRSEQNPYSGCKSVYFVLSAPVAQLAFPYFSPSSV